MNKNTKIFLIIVLIVIVISGTLIYFAGRNNNTSGINDSSDNGSVAGTSTNQDDQKDNAYIEKLAKFMTEKGMVLYGAYWCSHCQNQKKLFGEAFKYIDYVECDAQGPNANPDECVAQGIEGYPTWIYQGKQYSGEKSLSDLAKIVGFTDDTTADQPAE